MDEWAHRTILKTQERDSVVVLLRRPAAFEMQRRRVLRRRWAADSVQQVLVLRRPLSIDI